MSLSVETLALAKKYTNKTVIGLGALKGANCTIESVVHQDGLNIITFKWTGDDGTIERTQIEVEDGTPIYTWTAGDRYEYGDLVIYEAQFYRCIVTNSDSSFDETKWDAIGTADGMYGLVTSISHLPTSFTATDRRLYYVIEIGSFYLWNGTAWIEQIETEDIDFTNF